MNTNIRWLAAYTADIFDDYLAEIKLPIGDRVRSFRGRALALSFLGRTAQESHDARLGDDR